MFLSRKVIGMLWGIPATTWLELWSGSIGALVSAIGAAVVAWLVVKATNRHQGEIARAALEAQRADATEALRVQRELLEQQISEQRQEARWAEKTRALSEFVAGVRELNAIHDETTLHEVNATIRRLEASAATLDILGDDDEGLHSLLHPSIRTLHTLCVHVFFDYQIKGPRSGAREALADCARAICTLSPKWWSNEEGHERRFIRGEIRLTLKQADALCKKLKIQVTHPVS